VAKEDSVTFYTSGKAVIDVHFPNGMTVCRWCAHARYADGLRRSFCGLTGETLPYPDTSRGIICPVTFDNEEKIGE